MPISFEEFKKLPPSSFDLEYGFLSLAGSSFNKAESEMFAWAMLRTQQTQGDSWRPVEVQQIQRILRLDYYERRPQVLLLSRRAFMGLTPVYLLRRGFLRRTYGEYLEWTDAGLEVLFTHFEKQGGLLLW